MPDKKGTTKGNQLKKLDVLYQHDNNYAAWGGVSILSLLMNNSDVDDLTIWLIDNAVSAEYKNQYDSLAKEYGDALRSAAISTPFTLTVILLRCISRTCMTYWQVSLMSISLSLLIRRSMEVAES